MKIFPKILISLLPLSSCVTDTSQQRRSARDYGYENDPYQRPSITRGSGNRTAREQVLSGNYGNKSGDLNSETRQTATKVEDKGWVDPNQVVAKKYPIGDIPYAEIEPLLKKQLSTEGGMSYIQNYNSVLVLDKPLNHEKIKTTLDAVFREAVNIRVDLEFNNLKAFKDYGITVKHSGLVVDNKGIHGPKRADIDIRGQSNTEETNTRQFLTTMSGHPAQLWVTQTAVDKQIYQTYRFIPFVAVGGSAVVAVELPPPTIREVGASLYMRPTYTDDGLVIIELFPVITTEINGKQQSFRVEKVQTTITARPGQRVYLGGMNKEMNNFFTSIFNPIAIGKGKVTDIVDIYVTPSVMKLGNKP